MRRGCRRLTSDCVASFIWRSKATGPSRDLHSGVYGGASPNPDLGLIELLGTVKNRKGKIKVSGFYDDVLDPSKAEMESWEKLRSTKGISTR